MAAVREMMSRIASGAALLPVLAGLKAASATRRVEPGDDKPAQWPEPDFNDREGRVYRAPSRAGPGNDIDAGPPGFQKAPTRGPISLVAVRALTGSVRQWRPAGRRYA